MDSNAGDYFPSFLRMSGFDHLVLYGRAPAWCLLVIREGQIEFREAAPYVGMDNIDMRDAIQRDLGGVWKRNMSMVNITRAGENLVLTSGIMGGPKAIYARGGPGAKMGSLQLKAIVTLSPTRELPAAQPYKPYNRHIAQKLLGTSVVKNALSVTGTPFLYKPSRILGAMGTKNNQETTWTEALDAQHLDQYRPGMEGCFRCPVNCRPLNDLQNGRCRQYGKGDGPEYVTLGKFGPNLGIDTVEPVIRLNNICNDLGFDTASMGSAIGVGLRAVPARNHHHRTHRRAGAGVGRCRADRAAAVHDVAPRRLWQRARRQRACGRTRTLPGRSTEIPHGREGVVAERPARRAHPQGLRARARRGDPRHGSFA